MAMKAAAGVVVRAADGCMLFMKRAGAGDHAGSWALPGGGVEEGEDAESAARREVMEETGYTADELRPLDRTVAIGLDFTTFLHDAAEKFTPTLNDEHSEFVWAHPLNPPQPLHPGVAKTLASDAAWEEGKHKRDDSGKFGSGGGSSKPAASGGTENAGSKESSAASTKVELDKVDNGDLGRAAYHIGMVAKHGNEKNTKQHLEGLVGTSLAEKIMSHRGAMEEFYAKGEERDPAGKLKSLLLGTQSAAKDALAMDRDTVRSYDDNGRLRVSLTNISKANVCPYRGNEIPDWEELGLEPDKVYQLLRDPAALEIAAPTFNGVPVLNTHVPSTAWDHPSGKVVGTTGTDAVWSAPYLKNSLIIWKQEAIQGIESKEQQELSCGYKYRPVMEPGDYEGVKYDGRMVDILGNHVALVAAGRAGPDVIVGDSSFEPKDTGMTKKASLSRKASLARGALMAALKPLMAADAKLDLHPVLADVTAKNWTESKSRILAAIKPKLAADADMTDLVKLLDTLDSVEGVDDEPPAAVQQAAQPAVDADPAAEIGAMLKGKVDDAVLAAVLEKCKALAGGGAADVDPTLKPKGEDADPDDKEEKVGKQAMDAAIARARTETEAATISRFNAIGEARELVQPYVGRLTLAFDSAEAVYRAALGQLGVKHEGIHASALRAVLEAQPNPNAKRPTLATDSVVPQGFAERFPGVAGMRTI